MTTWRLNPDVILTPLDEGGAVLLDLNSKHYYTLNSTGYEVWQLLQQGCPEAELGGRLTWRYAITATEAQSAILALLQELARMQLISADA